MHSVCVSVCVHVFVCVCLTAQMIELLYAPNTLKDISSTNIYKVS